MYCTGITVGSVSSTGITVGSTDSITASLCVDQYDIGFFLYLTYNLKQNEANIMSKFCVVFIFLSTYASLCLKLHLMCYVRQWDFLQIRFKCKGVDILLYLVRYYSLTLGFIACKACKTCVPS